MSEVDEWVSDHIWKFDTETRTWSCSRCGHSFQWLDKGKDRIPEKFAPDGSPARDDPCWFGFHIVGLMSFINADEHIPDHMKEKFVEWSGLGPDKGTHAVSFHCCVLYKEMENLSAVYGVMEE